MAGEKNTEKPDTTEKKPEARLMLVARVRRVRRVRRVTQGQDAEEGKPRCSQNPILVRGIGRYSWLAVYSRKAMHRKKDSAAKTRIENKIRRNFLLLSQTQLVATRLVVLECFNFEKSLDIILLKMGPKS